MCETERKTYIPNGYKTMGTIITYFNKIFGPKFTKKDIPMLHELFKTQNYIKSVEVKRPNFERPILFYDATLFKNMIDNPQKYSSHINSLNNFLFGDGQNNVVTKINNVEEKEEEPWDETNMEYVNQQLLNKYQFESITLTKSQVNKLKTIL